MIIEYEDKYKEEVKDLFVELQSYIASIDKEKYNVLTPEYREKGFEENIKEINQYEGKMFLLKIEEKIVGLVIGIINNDEIDTYDFKAPKRGRIKELIVSEKYRKGGYGTILLEAMENHLKSVGCKDILIGVFAYNNDAIKFYEKNGYHFRMNDVTKTIS